MIFSLVPLKGQELSEGEMDLEMKAFELFENKEFNEAMPLFSQLLSLYPKEPNYNYGYAVCLIETNTNPKKAIEYLSFAATKSDNPVIYFYLGRANHLIYEFDDALKNYGSFKAKASKTDLREYATEQYISMAGNGKMLVKYISDLIVHDNKKIGRNNFHYSYELEDFGGKLIVKPPDFKTKVDVKRGGTELMFVSDSGFVYYSSYGENKKGSRDIYRAVKQEDGSWGLAEKLSMVVNTPYNDDYPFIHPDGKTLYFSSKGHNSMGGYDIFRSVYDTIKNDWSTPVNLDFPTNSPYDDYLFISDVSEDYAYFASNRETGHDRISVYKIEIDKEPIEREYNDLEEVIQKARLEVSPLALRTKTNNNESNTEVVNQYESNTANRKELNYNFNRIEFTNDLSAADLLEEANNDVVVVEEDLNNTKKESNIAYLMADEKNKQADKKRQEADEVKSTNPELAESLTNEARELEKEAVTAFNLAKNLAKSADEKEKDVQKVKELTNELADNESHSATEIYNQLNNNREQLNKSIDKSITIDAEIDNRQVLMNENKKNVEQKENELGNTRNSIEETKNQVSELENRYVNSDDDTEKDMIEGDLVQLSEDLEKDQIKEKELIKEINKLNVENTNMQDELAILKNIKTDIANDSTSDSEITENVNSLNKEDLEKNIFDKELIADHNTAVEIDNTNSDIELNSADYNNNETSNGDTDNINNETSVNNETENSSVDTSNESISNNVSVDATDNSNNVTSVNNETENSVAGANNESASNNVAENMTDSSNNETSVNNETENSSTDTNNTETATDNIAENSVDNNGSSEAVETSNENYLETEARKNRDLSDSLYFLADEKRKILEITEDLNERNKLEKDINELEELADIKRTQADDQFATLAENRKEDEIADNYISYQEDLIDNNPVFSFGRNESADSKVKQYEKELFNSRYYGNLAVEQEKKLDIMKASLENITNDEVKKTVEKEISKLEKLINYSKTAAIESETLAEQLKGEAIIELDDIQVSSEYLLVKATEYEPDNNLGLSSVQEETLEYTAEDRKAADGDLNDWYKAQNEVDDLEVLLKSTEDEVEKKKILKDIGEKQKEANESFEDVNKIYNESNEAEYDIYNELIEEKRIISNDRNVLLANELEKEADLYFEKAKLIRENANIIEEDKEKNTELIKAKNYELIAIQKQRHALDLYIGRTESSETELVANNENNTSVESAETTNDKSITLLPDEEKQLKQYRKESHRAETLEGQAEKLNIEVAELKEDAENTYSEKEKKKLLKSLEEKEQKAKDNMEEAYLAYGISDSLKYHLYKSQIKQLGDGLPEVKSNKLIADQYSKDADFYYEQGRIIRENAKSIENQEERIEVLARAVDFEKKALYSHEVAVDVLMNVDPVDFASSTALTKVDRLEVLNKPVNIDKVKKVQTDRIILALDLPEEDLEALDKSVGTKRKSEEVAESADELEKRIYELDNIIETSESSKVKKKSEKEKEKLTNEMYSNRFAAGDLSEQVNETKYWIYKNNLNSNRINGQSDKARQGRQLEKEANKKYNKAKSFRDKSFFTPDVKEAYGFVEKADSLELAAIEDLEKAYGLYLDLPSFEEDLMAMTDTAEKSTDIWDNIAIKSDADITPIETINDTTDYLADNENNDSGNMNNRNAVDDTNDPESNGSDDPNNRTAVNDSENNGGNEIAPDNTNDVGTNNENNNSDDPNNRTVVDETNDTNPNNTADDNSDNETNTNELADNNSNNENDTENNTNRNTEADGANEPDNNNPDNTSNRVAVSNSNAPGVLNYSIEPVSKYSTGSPIPMNPSLPEGIVFKIQVGAFRNAIPQDAFGGLSPVSGEKLSGSAFTRYLVGLFSTYEGATLVKDEVKTMGYRDAFIVAYQNGKRIPLYQARNVIREKSGDDKTQYDLLAQSEVNSIKNRAAAVANNNVADNSSNATNRNAAGSTSIVNGSDLKKVNGLLYTVQIGVYKQAITHDKLYNLSPIYEEKTQYGFTRYTTGVFNDYGVATAEKDRVVRLGIADAFVAVYFNGKRITLTEARNIENSNGSDIYAETNPVRMAEQPVDNNADLGDTENINISFRVQIGAYKEQVPTNIVSDFIRVAANHELDQKKDNTGVTIYTVGRFKSYDEANQKKDILINDGINDAFIVSYNGDSKIPISEALRLLSQ